MSLETTNICDWCNVKLDEGDEIYCTVCVEELKTELDELVCEVIDLRKEIDTLEAEVAEK